MPAHSFGVDPWLLTRLSASDRRAVRAWAARTNRARAGVMAAVSAVLTGLLGVRELALAGLTPMAIRQSGILLGCLTVLALGRFRAGRRWTVAAFACAIALFLAMSGAALSSYGFNPIFNGGIFMLAIAFVLDARQAALLLAGTLVACTLPFAIAGAAAAPLLGQAAWTVLAWVSSQLLFGAQVRALVATRRIAAQHRALADVNRRLVQLNDEKNDLMAIAAHDLKSPLTGLAAMLRITGRDAAERAWQPGVAALDAMERSCAEMAALVSRVLEAHQAEDRLDPLDLVSQDVAPIVRAVVDAHQPRAAAKQIGLTFHQTGGAAMARVDGSALARVVDNLVSNAVKYSPPATAVRVEVSAAAGGAVRAAVSDGGPGISEADQARLFRKFARLRPRPTGGEVSTGLGLFITKKLVEAMDGSVTCASAPGSGSTFSVVLPGTIDPPARA